MNSLTLSRPHVLAIFLLVMPGRPTIADTSFTSTHVFRGYPVSGPHYEDSSGLLHQKGMVQQQPELADDPRATGQLTSWTDMDYQPDGTATLSGHAYLEVGIWDATGTNFTPIGGVWALRISGVGQSNGNAQFAMTGYGIGGDIERMRFSETVTVIEGPIIPRIVGSGTIKAAPVNTRAVVDDFADNCFTWPACGVGPVPNPYPPGTFFASETNQQLTIGGTWPATTPRFTDSAAWADLPHTWGVSAGQTLEARVDVIALSQSASGTALALYYSSGQAYFVLAGRNFIALKKEEWLGFAPFRAVQATIKDTNIVLSLSLTPVGGNVVLTGKVLDKATGAVIAQVVATDTPASDPTLSASELAEVTGGRVWQGIVTDPVGAPHSSGIVPAIFVAQESETAPVTAFATFDNLEFRTYEVPQVGYERALRLFWPDTGMSFVIEGASKPEGPYFPIQNLDLPDMQYFTVPANGPQGFFRLQQAP